MDFTVTVLTRDAATSETRVIRDEHVSLQCLPESLRMIACSLELSVDELTYIGVIPEPPRKITATGMSSGVNKCACCYRTLPLSELELSRLTDNSVVLDEHKQPIYICSNFAECDAAINAQLEQDVMRNPKRVYGDLRSL